LIDRLEGDYPRARARLEGLRRDAARDVHMIGWDPDISRDLLALARGGLARAEGRAAEARAHLHGALRRIHRRGEGALLLSAACLAGTLEIARGAPARGVTLLAAGAAAGGEGPIGIISVPEVRVEAPDFLARARQTLGEAAYEAAWATGRAMTPEQAVAYALADPPEDASGPA